MSMIPKVILTFDILWILLGRDMKKLVEWLGKFVSIEDLTAEFYFENQDYHLRVKRILVGLAKKRGDCLDF